MNVSGPTTIAPMANRPSSPLGAALASIFEVQCRLPSDLMALLSALDQSGRRRWAAP